VTTIRRTSLLCVAILLAAATAAADTVITAEEVFPCSVVAVDTNFVRIKLPQGGIRVLYTRDIYEIRLSDSSRVAEQAAQPLKARVTYDSGQPIPVPAVRALEMPPLRKNLSRHPAEHAGALDTMCLVTRPVELMAKCGEMEILLRKRERNDTSIVNLLREVRNEQTALRGIWPNLRAYLLSGACGVLGMAGGTWLGSAVDQPQFALSNGPVYSIDDGACNPTCEPGGLCIGCIVGGVVGSMLGAGVDSLLREDALKKHRSRVNDLVRRFNRVVVEAP
jgi:hypothetical protein